MENYKQNGGETPTLDKIQAVLSHPATEIVARGAAGTVFAVKSVKHFRKGNWVRGALFGVSAAGQAIRLAKRLNDWRNQ